MAGMQAMLFVRDMERMKAFYRDGLGLELLAERSTPVWAEFAVGGAALLALHALPHEVATLIEVSEPPRPRIEAPTKLIFEVADLGAARRQLAAHGALMFEPWSLDRCDGVDPEGNVFQIAQA